VFVVYRYCIRLAYLILLNLFSLLGQCTVSAVFSLTVLSGLLFLLNDFFFVLLSMANKDPFIQT